MNDSATIICCTIISAITNLQEIDHETVKACNIKPPTLHYQETLAALQVSASSW